MIVNTSDIEHKVLSSYDSSGKEHAKEIANVIREILQSETYHVSSEIPFENKVISWSDFTKSYNTGDHTIYVTKYSHRTFDDFTIVRVSIKKNHRKTSDLYHTRIELVIVREDDYKFMRAFSSLTPEEASKQHNSYKTSGQTIDDFIFRKRGLIGSTLFGF